VSQRLALGLGLLLSACLAPRQAAEPRYFSPAGAAAATEAAAVAAPAGPELRLRRVTAADYLRSRMVWRRGVEVGFYDLSRWTQPPASYVEASLAQDLFERRGLRRVTRPDAASLTVSLLAFDDVLEPFHEGVVALAVLLVDKSQVARVDRTFSARRPVTGDRPEDVARALGEALSEAVNEVGAAVEGALGDRFR
jgi:ABC-type uncharacterized transport system auxiliary subunit